MSNQKPTSAGPKHLLTAADLARAATIDPRTDLTRAHGQGNGLRVHGIYFAVVSLAALVLIIAGIVVATAMM